MDPHENLALPRRRFRNVHQLEHVGPAVAAIHQRFHTRLVAYFYFKGE
jgi:hypothetical protein